MKVLTAILLSVFVSFAALGGDKNTSILVKQITESQRSELPDKTIQLKLQRYTLSDSPLAKEVLELVTEVIDKDLTHTAYVLKFHTTEQGELEVGVIGLEELKNSSLTKTAWGITTVDSRCVVLIDEKHGEAFNKAKGKHTLVQEYELVEDPIQVQHTVVYAIWHNGQLRATSYIIDDHDRLPERQRSESGVTHSDWWP